MKAIKRKEEKGLKRVGGDGRGMDPAMPLPFGNSNPRVNGSLRKDSQQHSVAPTAFRVMGLLKDHVGAPPGVSEPAWGGGGPSDSHKVGGEGGRCIHGVASMEEGRASRGAAWGRGDP